MQSEKARFPWNNKTQLGNIHEMYREKAFVMIQRRKINIGGGAGCCHQPQCSSDQTKTIDTPLIFKTEF